MLFKQTLVMMFNYPNKETKMNDDNKNDDDEQDIEGSDNVDDLYCGDDSKDDDSMEQESFELTGDETVLPLIIPNNCKYDPKTKQLIQDKNIERESLKIFEPALKVILSDEE